MTVKGNVDNAQSLLHEYYRVRYNRHPAFRREMLEVVGKSEVLCGMIGEL